MSKFSSYGKRVDEIARTAFAEYTAAESALKQAEARSKEYPQRWRTSIAPTRSRSTLEFWNC